MCAPEGKGIRPARAQPRPCINIDIFFPLDTKMPSTCPGSGRLQLPQRLSKAGTESAPPPGVRNNCAFPSAGGPGKLRRTRPTPARRHLYQKRPPPSLPTTRKPRGGVLRRGCRGQGMATADPSGPGVWMSTPGPRPAGTLDCAAGATGLPFGRSGSGVPRLGERLPAVVEKRGPYMVTRAPSIQAKLRECGPVGGVSAWAGYLVPRAGCGVPPGRPRRGKLQPVPSPKISSEKAGSWHFGRHGGVGKSPPLTRAL